MVIDSMIDRVDDLADGIDHALVGPRDSRQQEINTERFPFSTVVHLCRDFGNSRCSGCSGVLIAPDRVLTAAHCLWSPKRDAPPRRIGVAPGRRDRDTKPFGVIAARRAYTPRGFRERRGFGRKPFDFGIIILTSPFRRPTRFMPVRAPDDRALARLTSGGLLTIAGYPGDRPTGTMWRHSERLKRFDRSLLYYSVDTCPGHSGSPVWIKTREGPLIVGVHTSGILDEQGRSHGCTPGTVLAPSGMVNSGVRITERVLAAIREPFRRHGDLHDMVQVL